MVTAVHFGRRAAAAGIREQEDLGEGSSGKVMEMGAEGVAQMLLLGRRFQKKGGKEEKSVKNAFKVWHGQHSPLQQELAAPHEPGHLCN